MRNIPEIGLLSLFIGWAGLLAGIASGAIMGAFFHDEEWLGGYGSYRRRMLRLGHISFFGLGFLNLIFGLTQAVVFFPDRLSKIIAVCLFIGALTMPVCCFLSAWRKRLRHLFPLPVLSLAIGIGLILFTSRL